jgi:hypothetical protein
MPWAASGAGLMFPAPSNATSPNHVVIAPGASEQDFFWVKEKYPGTSVLTHYKKVFANWRHCTSDEKWMSYVDRADGADVFVHQQIHHWLKNSDDVAVALIIRYKSPGATARVTPDADDQFVALVRITQPNMRTQLGEMGVKCAKDS